MIYFSHLSAKRKESKLYGSQINLISSALHQTKWRFGNLNQKYYVNAYWVQTLSGIGFADNERSASFPSFTHHKALLFQKSGC